MLLAIGHGADATMYFQWRKSLGAFEKMHGAVVDHEGTDRTRVFQDVAAHGAFLKTARRRGRARPSGPRSRSSTTGRSRWALGLTAGAAAGPGRLGRPFDKEYIRDPAPSTTGRSGSSAIRVDVIESLSAFDRYKLVVAPMLFMLKPGVADRLEAFVKGGGTLVLTYLSGIVNETNIVFRGGWPGGGLREAGGHLVGGDRLALPGPAAAHRRRGRQRRWASTGEHPVRDYCERVHPEGATVLATFKNDFYAGMPALTVNRHGAGRVYYLAARPAGDAFLDGFTRGLRARAQARAQPGRRAARGRHRPEARGRRAHVPLPAQLAGARSRCSTSARSRLKDVSDGRIMTGRTTLAPFASFVLERV